VADIIVKDSQDAIRLTWYFVGLDAKERWDAVTQYRIVGLTYEDAVTRAETERAAGHEAQVRRSHECGFFEVCVTEIEEGDWQLIGGEEE
jgi:hypothetical protein